jgi:hypothetical protein
MFRRIIKSIVIYLIKEYELEIYKISELQIGGHCGCCGNWIPDEIFRATWWDSWGLCKECIGGMNYEKSYY